MTDPRHRTLFAVAADDRRARQQLAGDRGRGKRPTNRAASSDVTRFFTVAAAAMGAVAGLLISWIAYPNAQAGPSGALALPHQTAGLSCNNCHNDNAAPAATCVGCHGDHPSTRNAHRKLSSDGKMSCINCHDIHGGDQGIRWLPVDAGGTTLRYWVGRHAEVAAAPLPVEHAITVPLIAIGQCESCHSLKNERDPLWRCVSSKGDGVPRANALSGCFDEHRLATDVAPRAGKVCAAQHGGQRFAAWDAARAAAIAPSAELPPLRQQAHWWWLASAMLGALVSAGAASGWRRYRRRRSASKPAAALKPTARVRLPQIDTSTCLGCYACVDACPYDVLEIERYVAQVARPDACCGLTLCEQVCPNGSLVITDGEPIGGRPRVDDRLQAVDAPGIYLAGDITGLPLIKNAIMQGRDAIDALADSMPKHNEPLDVLIVGAGPAGISAALRAKELKLHYRVVEQGSVAQSVRSFPRGKLVFAQPLDLPLAGKLWLEESSKEELLSKWTRIVRQEKLIISEHTRLSSLERHGAAFSLNLLNLLDERSETARAACVLLCVGQRGTPRKLDIELDAVTESKVHYHLADARSFAGQHVLVVGLGDVAMEASIALARQADTTVTVCYRGTEFSRGKARNVAELKRLIAGGQVQMIWQSTVGQIGADEVTLRLPEGRRSIRNDAVLVLIGSLPPRALLEQAGVSLSGSPQT